MDNGAPANGMKRGGTYCFSNTEFTKVRGAEGTEKGKEEKSGSLTPRNARGFGMTRSMQIVDPFITSLAEL